MPRIKHDAHSLEWFSERIGQRIKRVAGGWITKKERALGVMIWNHVMAEYLFELQEQGYRYADMSAALKVEVLT